MENKNASNGGNPKPKPKLKNNGNATPAALKKKRPRPHRANKLKQAAQETKPPKIIPRKSEPKPTEPVLAEPNLAIQNCGQQSTGIAIKKRNDTCRPINPNLFNSNSNAPFFFESKSSVKLSPGSSSANLCERTEKLSLLHGSDSTNKTSTEPKSNSKGKLQTCQSNGIAYTESPRDGTNAVLNNSNANDSLQSASTSSNKTPKRNHQRRRSQSNSKSEEKTPARDFPDYVTLEVANAGLKDGTYLIGSVRINPKNFKEAYVNNEDKMLPDYLIPSVYDRNRALEGDVVVLEIKPESAWSNAHKTANVVHIRNKVHPRTAVGYLNLTYHRGQQIVLLNSRDYRVPRMEIIPQSLPYNYHQQNKIYEDTLFCAKLVEWRNTHHAKGAITEMLGQNSTLQAQTKAILAENDLDMSAFPMGIVAPYLPATDKPIPEKEFTYRADLRKECIFTIDPLTARDLDDAMSCKVLPNGNFEIGVHIADVAFHLQEGTPLDKLVQQRATSVYLVDRVLHMLPTEMCMHCSLLPGKDNLAFSVIWEITPNAEIVSERFTRSVINSCGQFAYEHAQQILDDASSENLPQIHGGFTKAHISKAIKDLNLIGQQLRDTRVTNGALRINRAQFGFSLDAQGEPKDYHVYERGEAHFLIEEFMILANVRVARAISEAYPDLAFLRRHDSPQSRMMVELKSVLERVGVQFDESSSKSIHDCLIKYSGNDIYGKARHDALSHLFAKPMIRAEYFCADNCEIGEYFHYALHTEYYTHFTSPIRRYADIMVHRLLAASLGYCDKPEWTVNYAKDIACTCNTQKYNAKKAGEASCELYLAQYVGSLPEFKKYAVVVDVKDRSYDVIVLETGTLIRMYTNQSDKSIVEVEKMKLPNEKKACKLTIFFSETKDYPESAQVIDLFQLVKINIKRKSKSNKLEAVLLNPAEVI